jgi:hypothetical protein
MITKHRLLAVLLLSVCACGPAASSDPAPEDPAPAAPPEATRRDPVAQADQALVGLDVEPSDPVGEEPDLTAGALQVTRPPAARADDGVDSAEPVVQPEVLALTGNGIAYHNGHVMDTQHVYMIYYGNWSAHVPSIVNVNTFLLGMLYDNMSTDWLGTTRGYTDRFGGRAARDFRPGPWATVGYTYGKNLVDSPSFHPVYHIVYDAIFRTRSLPNDRNGLYLVIPSSDVNVVSQGLGTVCKNYCGFHWFGGPGAFKWGLIMNDLRCSAEGLACRTVAASTMPNRDGIADPAVNIIAHELSEAATDPGGDAWYSIFGLEDGDLCAWKFHNVGHPRPGVTANIHDRTYNRFWLIQDIWSRGGGCTMGRTR